MTPPSCTHRCTLLGTWSMSKPTATVQCLPSKVKELGIVFQTKITMICSECFDPEEHVTEILRCSKLAGTGNSWAVILRRKPCQWPLAETLVCDILRLAPFQRVWLETLCLSPYHVVTGRCVCLCMRTYTLYIYNYTYYTQSILHYIYKCIYTYIHACVMHKNVQWMSMNICKCACLRMFDYLIASHNTQCFLYASSRVSGGVFQSIDSSLCFSSWHWQSNLAVDRSTVPHFPNDWNFLE